MREPTTRYKVFSIFTSERAGESGVLTMFGLVAQAAGLPCVAITYCHISVCELLESAFFCLKKTPQTAENRRQMPAYVPHLRLARDRGRP
jgi:DNA-binding transcriptional regulator YbjK